MNDRTVNGSPTQQPVAQPQGGVEALPAPLQAAPLCMVFNKLLYSVHNQSSISSAVQA